MSKEYKEWQCPPAGTKESERLGWVNEANEEGESWLKQQRGYSDYDKAFKILSGDRTILDTPQYRSLLTTGRLKRNIREVIGACANIRPIWAYASDNPSFSAQCNMMNRVMRAIYLERNLDLGIKEALQWSAATATGWLRPVYRRKMYGTGKGDLTFLTYGSPSILPTQLPSNGDFQEAYAMTIVDELPIAMAHGMFPEYQERLTPTRSKFWYAKDTRKAAKGNMFRRIWGMGKRGDVSMLSDLYVPVRYTYVIDLTLNKLKLKKPLPMGQPGTSWYYEVPELGSDIPTGRDRSGNPTFRKADENDARLYPYRRLLISSEDCIMYDGPAFDWHGEFPAIPFCLDKWVWEAVGLSLMRDGIQVDGALNELERGVLDKHRTRLDPALAYDINSVQHQQAKTFDPMAPRQRIGFDGTLVERPFVPVTPDEMLRVDPMTMDFIEHLKETGDYQLAIRDIVALSKARSLGGAVDDAQKIMEADGPIVRDISRNIERLLSGTGGQCKYHVLQWYGVRRVMQYVGEDGITRETLDYDPASLVPSHMPGENTVDPSAYDKIKRARNFADSLRLYITPHSAHEITQMSHRLGLIQMRKAGVQIDSRTIAESWDLYDFGNRPRGNTIYERYWDEQNDMAIHAIKMQQMIKGIQEQGVAPTPALQNAMGETPFVPPREGRPPTGQEGPQLVSKEGGGRSTISESGT